MGINYLQILLNLINHQESINGEYVHTKDALIIKDCFDLLCPLNIDEGCCILLDEKSRVISIYSKEYPDEVKEIISRVVNIPLHGNYDGKLAKEVEINGVKSYHYKMNIDEIAGQTYYLCAFTNRDKDITSILKKTCDSLIKVLQLIDKHAKKYDFILKSLDAVEDGISICDKHGAMVYANSACTKTIGFEKSDYYTAFIEEHAVNKPTLRRILDSKTNLIDYEVCLELKTNKRRIHLFNSGYPVFDESGQSLLGAINIFREFNRSKELANNIAGFKATYDFNKIIGKSDIIKETIKLAKIYAKMEQNLLIEGESGTGKELFAQSIHNFSNRKNDPFIPINCANFPNELIDSELFGYEDGAFTGAKKGGKPGKFELANGGTLFLDEIGEMQLHLQAKLLRVVETKRINRLGGNNFKQIDVRIIAATNRNLRKMVEEGKFREDLYYRLKVCYINIPSLRERKEDVLILSDYFLKELNKKMQKEFNNIEDDAKELLMAYSWPGNVRELENMISRVLYILDDNCLKKEHLLQIGFSDNKGTFRKQKKLMESIKEIVQDTVNATGGNKKKAAEILGVSRATIYNMLKK